MCGPGAALRGCPLNLWRYLPGVARMTHSLELTVIAGEKAAKAFRAVKQFDSTVLMGPLLQLMREKKALEIHLDRADRAEILRRLVELLNELERLEIPYEISVNNVPRSSHLWKPRSWTRPDVIAELAAAEIVAEERRRAAELYKDYVPPEPPPSRKLLDQRWRDLEFSELLASEQNFIYIWAMRAEVENGGFAQYFDNSSGDDALLTQAALAAIGSIELHAILSDAIQLLETAGGYTTDRRARWEITGQLAEDAMIALNSRFYDASEDVVALAFRFVETDYQSRSML